MAVCVCSLLSSLTPENTWIQDFGQLGSTEFATEPNSTPTQNDPVCVSNTDPGAQELEQQTAGTRRPIWLKCSNTTPPCSFFFAQKGMIFRLHPSLKQGSNLSESPCCCHFHLVSLWTAPDPLLPQGRFISCNLAQKPSQTNPSHAPKFCLWTSCLKCTNDKRPCGFCLLEVPRFPGLLHPLSVVW